ncbi:hypothetical protein AAHZ94_28875, partial [Streptomyces sp. HSW2009]
MTNVRSLSPAPVSAASAAVSAAPLSPATAGATAAPLRTRPQPPRQRLRAVAPDELPPVADQLHADAPWLPAPPHPQS